MSTRHLLLAGVAVAALLVAGPRNGAAAAPDDGTGLPSRVEALEALAEDLDARLELLETGEPRFVRVDCANGETITDALNENAGWPGRLVIRVAGVCEESVSISRNDVYLGGETPEDGVRAPIGQPALAVSDAANVDLHSLTVFRDSEGLAIEFGGSASVRVFEITMLGGEMSVNARSSAFVYASRFEGGQGFGVAVRGDAELLECEIRGFDYGVAAMEGGRIKGYSCTVSQNNTGIGAYGGGFVSFDQTTIEGNHFGCHGGGNATILLGGGSVVRNNNVGISADASSLNINDTEVYGNLGPGIQANLSSTLNVFDVAIHDNGGDGIELNGMSAGQGGWGATGGPPDDPIQIFDNGGWGINCAGPTAIQAAQNNFAMDYIEFSGNALGDTNCP